MFCSGGKIKTVEDEVATNDCIEVGDDDMTKEEPWLDDDKKKMRDN
jgi:hypothetical protein